METSERCQWRLSVVFIVNIEYILRIASIAYFGQDKNETKKFQIFSGKTIRTLYENITFLRKQIGPKNSVIKSLTETQTSVVKAMMYPNNK